MICEYGDSDKEEDDDSRKESKTRCKSLTKEDAGRRKSNAGEKGNINLNAFNILNTPSHDSSFSRDLLINEDIMKMINGEDEPSKKRIKSPSQTYSKQKLLTKMRTVENTTKMEISCSSEVKSPMLGKNYILKPNIASVKFYTPSSSANSNPLLNYYKSQNISPLSRGMSVTGDISDSPFRGSTGGGGGLEELSFPLDDNSNKLNGNDFDHNYFTASPGKGKLNTEAKEYLPLYFFDQKPKQSKNDYTFNSNGHNSQNDTQASNIFGVGIHQQMQQQIQQQQIQQQQIQQQQKEHNPKPSFTPMKQQQHQQQQQQTPSQSNQLQHQQFPIMHQEPPHQMFNNNPGLQGNQQPNNLYSLYTSSSNGMNEMSPMNHQSMNMGFQNNPMQQNYDRDEYQNQQSQMMLGSNQNLTGIHLNDNMIYPQQKSSKKIKATNKNFADYSNEELIEKASEIASEQNGCRFIQKKIELEPELGNDIFEALERDLLTLTCDSFGNYLLQKLMCVIDEDKIERFVDIITPFFVKVSVSSHGTRVVQKLLDRIQQNAVLITKITTVLNHNLIEIITDANSNHIIQKYVDVVHSPMNQPVYDSVIRDFLQISKDKYGCCVMQKCITGGSFEQRQALIYLSINNSDLLITDQYGNYVLQCIVGLNNRDIMTSIINLVTRNIKKYCTQKFSSNVIEKCLDQAGSDLQMVLINAIVLNEGVVAELIVDLFGNYIIQKILSLTKGKAYYSLLQIISKNADKIKKVSFGHKVLSKMMNTHKDLCFMINSQSMMPQMGMNQCYYNQQPQQIQQPQLQQQQQQGRQYGYNMNSMNMNTMNTMNNLNTMNTMNSMNNQQGNVMDMYPQMNNYYDMNMNMNMNMSMNPNLNMRQGFQPKNGWENNQQQYR